MRLTQNVAKTLSNSSTALMLSSLYFATFFPLIVAKFGRLDDFGFYLFTRNDELGVVQSGLSYGRPISSLIFGWSFARVQTINGFSLLRLLSLLVLCLIVLLALKLYDVGSIRDVRLIVSITLLFISLPGLWVFMTWAQGLPHFIAMFFALMSAYRYILQKPVSYFFFSSLAMFTYQPFGLLIPALIMTRIIALKRPNYMQDFVIVVSSTLFLLLGNFVLVRSQPNPNRRSGITEDFEGKLRWLFSEWFPRSLFPWNISNHSLYGLIALIFFCLLLFRYAIKSPLKVTLILLTCALLPSIPFVLSTDNWASSRAVLASNISFGLVLTLLLTKNFSHGRFVDLHSFLCNLFAIAMFLVSILHGYKGLVYPQVTEWSMVSQQIRSVDKDVKQIRSSLAPFEQTSSPYTSYDEFGILNSSVEVPLRGMIRMALAEIGLSEVEVVIDNKRFCQHKLSYYDYTSRILHLKPVTGSEFGCQG